jgi:hypothetical protein
MNAHNAVLAGVQLLDERGPADWRDTLKKNATTLTPLDSLDMRYGKPLSEGISQCCVLAHVFGSFSRGCNALGITVNDAQAYGFDISYYGHEEPSVRYAYLNLAWKAWLACA